jgi:hypothetical protein
MKSQLTTHIFTQTALYAGVAASLIVAMLTVGFFALEPQISRAQVDTSNDFFIRQTITGETSFLVEPTNVNMSGSISGISGGSATGTTQFSVISNSSTGYRVEIDFFDNGGDHAMLGDIDGGEEIRDYAAGAGTPTPNMTASTAAQFAYSVHSSSSQDTADEFWYNAGACNTGSGSVHGMCWKSPSTSPVEIVNRNFATGGAGATSTLIFKVNVPAGANPVPTTQTYTATATLSLFLQ